jgi:hypothetical protein
LEKELEQERREKEKLEKEAKQREEDLKQLEKVSSKESAFVDFIFPFPIHAHFCKCFSLVNTSLLYVGIQGSSRSTKRAREECKTTQR